MSFFLITALATLPLLGLSGWVSLREHVPIWITSLTAGGLWSVAALLWGFSQSDPLGAWAGILAVWGVACVVDLREHRLPDRLTLFGYPLLLLALAASAQFGGVFERWWCALGGGLISAALFLGIGLISPGQLGLGDVKLSLTTGTVLGWFGWAALLTGQGAAFVAFAVVGGLYVLLRRAEFSIELPFGPFMVMGALLGPLGSRYLF